MQTKETVFMKWQSLISGENKKIFQNVACQVFFLFFFLAAVCWVLNSMCIKMPKKPASESVVCLCHLLNILANFSNLRQTVWILIRLLLGEQSDLGLHCLQKWLLKSQADDKADICCDWQLKGYLHFLPFFFFFLLLFQNKTRAQLFKTNDVVS